MMKKPPKGGPILAAGLALVGSAYYLYRKNQEAQVDNKNYLESMQAKKDEDVRKDFNNSVDKIKAGSSASKDEAEEIAKKSLEDQFKHLESMNERED